MPIVSVHVGLGKRLPDAQVRYISQVELDAEVRGHETNAVNVCLEVVGAATFKHQGMDQVPDLVLKSGTARA